MSGKCVTKCMRMGWRCAPAVEKPANISGTEPVLSLISEQRLGPAGSIDDLVDPRVQVIEIVRDCLLCWLAQRDDSLLVALSPHPNDARAQVHRIHIKATYLAHSETRTVQKLDDCVVAESARRTKIGFEARIRIVAQKRSELIIGQDRRQSRRRSGRRQSSRRVPVNVTVDSRPAEETPKSAHLAGDGATRIALLIEVSEVTPDETPIDVVNRSPLREGCPVGKRHDVAPVHGRRRLAHAM